MTFRFLIWVLITLFMGYALIPLIWPKQRASLSEFCIRVCLAAGLGVGISSGVFFISLTLSPQLTKWLFIPEAIIVIILLLLQLNRSSARTVPQTFVTASKPVHRWNVLLWLGFCVILSSSIVIFLLLSLASPHGGYDGWAIWNMRARFLFRGVSHWTEAFSTLLYYSHPDYPLLLPTSIARSWIYTGNETQVTPIAIAMFFTFATVGLLTLSLSLLRSTSQGLLAGLVLLGTPYFLRRGATQYADVPLGFYLLASLVLLNFRTAFPESTRGVLALAGTMVGLSAWTKNEGLLFLGTIILSFFILPVRLKGWKQSVRQMTPFLFGLMPILILVGYFKAAVAPPNDLISEQQGLWSVIEKLLTFSRYWEIARAFFEQAFSFGLWHPYANVPLVLVYYALLAGKNVDDREQSSIQRSVAVIALITLGYFFTYVLTPRPLKWHLDTSLNRLFLQLWPSFLFIYFLIVRTPEMAMVVSGGKLERSLQSKF